MGRHAAREWPGRASLHDAYLAEAILRHITQAKMALEQARRVHVTAAAGLTKEQKKDEIFRTMEALGLLEDFVLGHTVLKLEGKKP